MADTLEDQGAQNLTEPTQAGIGAGADQAGALANDTANQSPDFIAPLQNRSPGAGNGGGGGGRLSNLSRKAAAFIGRNKRGIGAGGGIAGLLGALLLIFLGLLPLKLVNLREVYNRYFGQRVDHQTSHAAGKIWKAVADKDGTVTLRRDTGHPLKDHIFNTNSKKIVADMKKRGLNVDLDPNTHKIRLDGKPISGKLADRRSAIRLELKEAYPQDGYIRRSLRAQRTFKIFGIKRTFFENSKEKVNDWEKKVRKKIRQRLFGSDTTDPTIKAKTDPASKDTQTGKALEDLNNTVGDKAHELQGKMLNDDGGKTASEFENGTTVNTNIDPAELAKIGAKTSVRGALNVTYALSVVCNIKNLMTEMKIAAVIYRKRSLVRYAGVALVAADQIKNGEKVPAKEMNALMKGLSEVEKSGGFQRASGLNPNAKIKTASKYSLDLTKQGGGAAFFINLSDKLDAVYGGNTTCKVVTNIFFQIGATAATVVAGIVSGSVTSVLSGAAQSAAVSVVIAMVEEILKPMAIQMLAGMTVTGDEPGEDKGDAIFAGADIMFNEFSKQNGGHTLSAQQASQLDDTIAVEQAQDDQARGISYQMFSLDNPRSIASKMLFTTPSSISGAFASLGSYIASINPFMISRNVVQPGGILARMTGPATAVGPPVDDPMGVAQRGLTDAELDRFDPIENENFIMDDPSTTQQYKDFEKKCLISSDIDPEDADDCDGPQDDMKIRFRTYHFYRGLAGGIEFLTGSTDTLPQDDDDESEQPQDDSGDTPIVGGDASKLAKEVLSNSKIQLTDQARSDIKATADDKQINNSDSCGNSVSVNSSLLQLMTALAQKHTFKIGYIITGHGCDRAFHPRGRAMDVWTADGKNAWQSGGFMQDTVTLLPAGGEFGQQDCPGAPKVHRSGINFNPGDACNHQHISVGASAK